ncbi:MAG: aminotransferase class V-fold PLP-dependent enzyme [Acidobacteria bacterium]|nr:aminotransferase class V-fold PLP-dependent enzyme [Acidobacteriota bacterium]
MSSCGGATLQRTRREFLRGCAGLGGAALVAPLLDDGISRVAAAAPAARGRSPESVAVDEDYWREIQQAFAVDRAIINLNNGGVSPSPRIVQDALRRHLEFSNQAPAYTMWQILEPEIEAVRRRLARTFGCDPEELAITRNTSEALEICLLGIDLRAGDEVLTTTQDYPRMLTTLEQRARREGIVVRKIRFPTPPRSPEDLTALFASGLTPRTRAILVCHITNLTGQIFPVRDICRMARQRGIEVIVDGAHAFAHLPFTRDDLECDYYGTSLHKWLCAPIGTGFLYVRREKIGTLWPLMAAPGEMDGNIRKYEEIGTHPAANHNAIAEALTFHDGIGAARKLARLRYLRDRWMRRLDGQRGTILRTSYDAAQSGALANVALEGVAPEALAAHLWDRHRILVTPITHEECPGIRVTPNVYTTPDEIDRFAEAIEGVIRRGLPG